MGDDQQQQDIDINFKMRVDGDKDVTGAYARLQAQLDETRKTGETLNKALAEIKKDSDVRDLGRFYGQLAVSINDSERAASLLANRLQDIGASTDDIRKAADEFERMRDAQENVSGGSGGGSLSQLRRTGSALSQLGADDIGGALSRAGDIGQVLKEVGDVLPEVASGAVAAAGGLAPFVAVLAPIAGIVGLAAFAVNDYNNKLKENHDAFAASLADQEKQRQFAVSNITASRNTTPGQNIQNAQDLQTQFEQQQQALNDLQARKDAVDSQLSSPGQALQTILGNRGSTEALKDQSGQLQKAIDDGVKNLKDLQDSITNVVTVLGPAVEANAAKKKSEEDATKATNDRAAIIAATAQTELKVQNEVSTLTKDQAQARLKAIADERQSVQDQIAQLSALPNRTGAVSDRLGVLGAQLDTLKQESQGLSGAINSLPTDFKNAATELAKVNEQLQTENAKYTQTVADRVIQDTRNTALAAQQAIIDSDKAREKQQENSAKINELITKASDAEATALENMYTKRNSINQTAMENELKLLESYQKAESRATEDYSTERVRKLRDLYNDLTSIAGTRDVAAFIARRSSGLQDVQDSDSNFSTAAQRRKEDYEQSVKDAENARQQQLADLMVSFEKERTARAVSLQQQIDQQKAAGVVTLKQSDIDERKLLDLKASYAKQDIEGRRRIEDAAHQDQLNKLTQHQQAITAIIAQGLDPLVQPIVAIGNAIVTMINNARNALTSSAPTPSTHTPSASASGTPGLYVSPSGNRGLTVNIHNPMFGQIATPADVEAGKEFIVSALEQVVGVA